MNNINPIFVTVGTVILTNILTNVVTRFPTLFHGIAPDTISILAGAILSALIVWGSTWLHGKNTANQVTKASNLNGAPASQA